jgi:hypothetical protein
MLANPEETSARKKDALEALGQMDSVRDAFFLPYMESADAEVRRGAYLGIGKLSESTLGYRLLQSLQKETDLLARANLYEALSAKDAGNPLLLNQFASAESSPEIRLLAAKALARSIQNAPPQDPGRVLFEKTWIPELLQLVLGGGRQDRAQAFQALLIAPQSPSSKEALSRIAEESQVPAIQSHAARALARINKK